MLIGNMRDFVFDKPAAGHYCPNIGAMEEELDCLNGDGCRCELNLLNYSAASNEIILG